MLDATAGFEDVVELGRQNRADLYRLCVGHPPPLVAPLRTPFRETPACVLPTQLTQKGAS